MLSKPQRGGVRGILADVTRLEALLHLSLIVLAVASAVRYVDGHGLGDDAAWVLGGAALLLVLYAVYPLSGLSRTSWGPPAWCLALVVVWLVLVVLAPSFAWLAVPLAFVALRVLRFGYACLVLAGMVTAVVVSWTRMQGELDLTIVTGPVCIAVLAVAAYRALEQAATTRQQLLDELEEAQGDLLDAQHRAGVIAERARLSREIHDGVAQSLSSINLLLQAAEQDWIDRPAAAREHVGQAALTARDALDDVRRVVRDLAPAELAVDTGAGLVGALEQTCERLARGTGIAVDVRVHGDVAPLPPEVAAALLRSARGALANVIEHSGAQAATVTLTYQPDVVLLDVRDDGHGFDPTRVGGAGDRGHGLAGIRSRLERLGGALVIESGVGEGTVLGVSAPLREGR
jgi:signal transduction histidine kinase